MRTLIGLAALFLASSAYAGDGYQGRPSVCGEIVPGPRLEACHYWVQTVQRPDIRGASCCGEADLFIADNFTVKANGEVWMTVTADYPPSSYTDEEGNTFTTPGKYHKGSEVLIPPEKLNKLMEDANKSGHGAFFARPSDGEILCAFLPPLV